MIKRNWKRIIASLILMVMFFPKVNSFALQPEDAGRVIADFAKDFISKNETDTIDGTVYDTLDNRKTHGYKLLPTNGVPGDPEGNPKPDFRYSNKIPFDCVGFVTAMIHNAIPSIGTSDWSNWFITPTNNSLHANYFDTIGTNKNDWKPGDVLRSAGNHVCIYLGGNQVAESNCIGTFKGAMIGNISTYTYTAFRLKSNIVSGLSMADCNTVAGATLGYYNESEFYFNGIPNGEYSVVGSIWEILVTMLAEIFKLLVNLIFYLFRMVFVGFTAIIDNLITYIVKTIMGVPSNPFKDATSGWRNDDESVDKVNIETIIFGEKDESTGEYNNIFDVNFFKLVTP